MFVLSLSFKAFLENYCHAHNLCIFFSRSFILSHLTKIIDLFTIDLSQKSRFLGPLFRSIIQDSVHFSFSKYQKPNNNSRHHALDINSGSEVEVFCLPRVDYFDRNYTINRKQRLKMVLRESALHAQRVGTKKSGGQFFEPIN